MSDELEQALVVLGMRLESATLTRTSTSTSTRGSFAVVAATHIALRTVVASAPKTATLSPRTSMDMHSLSLKLAPALQLAACVVYETLLGPASRWSVYLAHLPRDSALSTVAGVWHGEGTPIAWARGTELARELERVGVSHATLARVYATVVRPLLVRVLARHAHAAQPQPSPALFLRAYALVTSRAFLVDNFHRLALVPLFDLFNHSTDASNVHLESHEWVCPVCGYWDSCEHDKDPDSDPDPDPDPGEPTVLNGSDDNQVDDDERIELVAHAPVEPGDEIFNTYGAALSNARLLLEYGFISEANPWDRSIFTFDDVLASPADLADLAPSAASVRELVGAGDSDQGPLTAAEGREGGELFFDADANVSVGLWCALVCRHRGLRANFAGLYRRLEQCWDEAHESHSFAPEDPGDEADDDEEALNLVARDIVILARGRRTGAQVHRPDLLPADLLALADEEPDAATRLAMEFAAGERLRLLCVEERWSNLRQHLDGAE